MRRRISIAAAIAASCGLGMIAVAHSLSSASDGTPGAIITVGKSPADDRAKDGFLAFTRTPRRPGNLLERVGVVGHSAEGRPIVLRQLGDPSIAGRVLVFGCVHGDECAAKGLVPTRTDAPIRTRTSSWCRT